MSVYQAQKTLSGLKKLLERAKQEEQRFLDLNLCAVGVFAEGRPQFEVFDQLHSNTIAQFLKVPASNVQSVEGMHFANGRDTSHDGPFFVYLRPDQSGDAASTKPSLQNGLNALNRFLPNLLEQVQSIPLGLNGRPIPDEVSNWWSLLFHLAIHYPQLELQANRSRWINITGPAPGNPPEAVLGIRYPHEDLWQEEWFQINGLYSPFDDIIPGTIWSQLRDNVFTSTTRAIEVLIEWLEQATLNPPPLESAVVHNRYAELHSQFTELAVWENNRPKPKKGGPDNDVPDYFYSGFQLIKVASSFRTRPAYEWCDFPMSMAPKNVLLSRHHSNAEYLYYHLMSEQFLAMCEEAGRSLPHNIPDKPVIFSRPFGPGGLIGCGKAELNPAAAARWIRFVFNSLRHNDPMGEEVEIHYVDGSKDMQYPWPDIFGYATLRNGFFAASARAIELAGLLLQQPTLVPVAEKPKVKNKVPIHTTPIFSLIGLYSNGVTDERIKEAASVLENQNLTANEKLCKLHQLLPLPSTASANDLGKMLGVTASAVKKTDWWAQNRVGEKKNEIGRRRESHIERAKRHETTRSENDSE